MTTGTNRRLRVFAVTQIAASFVLLTGAGALVTTLFALQRQRTGFRGSVLAVNVPVVSYERKPEQVAAFYREAIRRVSVLPGVDQVAVGAVVPWRDPGFFAAQFTIEGYRRPARRIRGRDSGRCAGFFSALGVRMIAGRDFTDSDRRGRTGRHRQPEPRAPHVPQSGCGKSPYDVDRRFDEIRRDQHGSAAHRRRGRRYRRREPGA
jgi:hypothetical protein